MNGRDLGTWLIGRSGLAALARRILVGEGRFALNFHGVSSHRYSNVTRELQPYHSATEFRQVLSWLSSQFAFLSVDEFLHGSGPGVLLTFDDGYSNNLANILPILSEFRAQGLFFISTQHVLKPRNWLAFIRQEVQRGWGGEAFVPDDFARDCYDGLSESQLAELARGQWAVIGAHTVTHPSLPACSLEQIKMELNEARDYLHIVTGQSIDYFAYPYGDYNRLVAEAVREAGFGTAFTVDPIPVGLPAYEIPRVGIYYARPDYLSVKLSGLHRPALRGPALAAGNGR